MSDKKDLSWEFFKDKNPEAIFEYYNDITNVPEEHHDDARTKAQRLPKDCREDFLDPILGETIPNRVSREIEIECMSTVLKGLSEHIKSSSEDIIEDTFSDESLPLEIPPDRKSVTVYQTHVMTITYLETTADLLLKNFGEWDSENREELIDWGEGENKAGDLNGTEEEKTFQVVEWVFENSNMKTRLLALKNSGIMENEEYKACNRVRKIRNEFVHNTANAFISEFSDGEELINSVEDCITAVETMGVLAEDIRSEIVPGRLSGMFE